MRFVLKKASDLPGEFEIEFVKLKDGHYDFQNEAKLSFFEYFENPDVKGAQVDVSLGLDKNVHMMQVIIQVKGTVDVTCDRCLELIARPVQSQYRIVYHFQGDVNHQADEEQLEVEYVELAHNATSFNVARQVYETILLCIPMIRNCDDMEIKPCNSQMLEKLNTLQAGEEAQADPRWDKLKELFKK